MKTNLIILAAVLLIASALWAQPHAEFGTVAGTVTLRNGNPVAEATVTLYWNPPAQPFETQTDAAGYYSIDSVYAGFYWGKADKEGFSEEWKTVSVDEEETTTVNFVLEGSLDDVGSVAGVVVFSNGEGAVDAEIRLDGGDPMHGHHGIHRVTHSDLYGQFAFNSVPVGPYEVSVCMRMHGWTSTNIEVVANQTTNVTITIQSNDSSDHPNHGDSLTVIPLQGTAIVLPPDSAHHRVRFFLDVNGDNVPEYRLAFGPHWYNPPNGAHRPNNGDEITIIGGLLTYAEPPIVVVYAINGQFWRQYGQGHGGYGGQTAYEIQKCGEQTSFSNIPAQLNPIAFETRGEFTFTLCIPEPVNPPGVFLFMSYSGDLFKVNLGSDYIGNPGNFHSTSIVGGLVPGLNGEEPWVIVYELGSQLIREPGDTTNLASMDAVDPVYTGSPTTYLTADNYPNPFNPVTTISYSVPNAGNVKLTIFDLVGRVVSEPVNSYQTAGTYSITWNGSNFPSGIYFYRLEANHNCFSNRMILLK